MARVRVGDTEGPAPYSVVRHIIEWRSGAPGNSVSRSTNQGEPLVSGLKSSVSTEDLSCSAENGERDGVEGKPKRFSLPAPSEAYSLHVSDENVDPLEIDPSLTLSRASALAGVEGEYTPAHTQGAGEQETANPPKAHEESGAQKDSAPEDVSKPIRVVR